MVTVLTATAHAQTVPVKPPSAAPSHTATSAARCLKAAYPGKVCDVTTAHVVFCDGSRAPFARNGPPRTHAQQLLDGTVAEQLAQAYPLGRPTQPPGVDVEPGRIRSQAFFTAIYGKTAKAVAKNTTTIRWMPRTVGKSLRVSTIGGAHLALAKVGQALDRLPKRIREQAAKTSGTFVWRKIRGTNRLSAHSFGIAVDVAVKKSDYWRWRKPDAKGHYAYRNRIPWEIVAAFEKNGFIWGGRWYRYDTMHFEYRPDLLHPACRAQAPKPTKGASR